MRLLIGCLSALAALSSGASAQPAGQPPPPAILRGQPVLPAVPIRPLDPRGDDSQLRPLQTQSTLPVETFSTAGLECSASLDSASIQVDARLTIQPNSATFGQAQIEILVDGVSAGAETLLVVDDAVTVSRRIRLVGAAGEHQVVFVLDGAVHSEAQAFSRSCVQQTVTATDVRPGVLTLPNLAFGNVLYAQLAPSARREAPTESPPPASASAGVATAALLERRVTLAPRTSFRDPIIVRDLQTLVGRVQFPSTSYCPGEVDAYVSAMFAVAVRTSRVPDPAPYAQVIAGPFDTPVSYVDTLDAPRWASGEAVGTDTEFVGTPLPQGYQWIVFNAGLECTRDGVLELRFDPGDTLRESREDDNVLRIRYATVAQ